MKVVRIIARLNVGGPARHVVWLTAGLQSAGCESVLVAGVVPPGEDDLGYFAAEHGVEPLIIPQMSREISPKDALTIWKLYRLFVRERPSIVHTHTAKAGTVGRLAGLLYRWMALTTLTGRPRRCRFVHTYHGHIFHSYYGNFKTRVFLAIEKALARLVTDKIIVISPQQFREINEEFGVGQTSQFAVIPLGLDTSVFAGWEERRRVLRDELNVGEGVTLVGIVGRLTEVKNHALFLRAAALLKAKLNLSNDQGQVRFVIIGDGRLRDKLEAQTRELGLSGLVHFVGTRKDPENFYAALDIVALTSLNEGTPLTLLEAMANARAVIATKVGGVVDLLGEKACDQYALGDHGQKDFELYVRGVGVEVNNAEAFCSGLAYLIAAPDVRHAIGERGRRFVEQNYSKDRLIKDMTNLYRELAKETVESKVQGPKAKVENDSSTLDVGL